MPLNRARYRATHDDWPEIVRDRNKNWRRRKYRSLWSPRECVIQIAFHAMLACLACFYILWCLRCSKQYKAPAARAKIPKRDALMVEVKGGAAVNQDKLWQRVVCIGHLQAIVSVYGVGMHGRVFGVGLRPGRCLIVSLYLPKHSITYRLQVGGHVVHHLDPSICAPHRCVVRLCHAVCAVVVVVVVVLYGMSQVSMEDLEALFVQSNLADFLLPGHKFDLCGLLVDMVEVRTQTEENSGSEVEDEVSDANSSSEDNCSEHRDSVSDDVDNESSSRKDAELEGTAEPSLQDAATRPVCIRDRVAYLTPGIKHRAGYEVRRRWGMLDLSGMTASPFPSPLTWRAARGSRGKQLQRVEAARKRRAEFRERQAALAAVEGARLEALDAADREAHAVRVAQLEAEEAAAKCKLFAHGSSIECYQAHSG